MIASGCTKQIQPILLLFGRLSSRLLILHYLFAVALGLAVPLIGSKRLKVLHSDILLIL